jgi:maltose O-acetyltransferase
VLDYILDQASRIKSKAEIRLKHRRWRKLRELGMHIGKGVNLPMSTWIDTAHCFLISIGDNCGFGDMCMILAHDAMPNEYIDATRVGRVIIHESCHFGVGTVILPGVEIGPRSVVGSNSVVVDDIPPNTLAAGNPARVICSLDEFLEKHRQAMKTAPLFPYKEYDIKYLTPARREEMIARLLNTDGYITGGYTAMVEDGECLVRT